MAQDKKKERHTSGGQRLGSSRELARMVRYEYHPHKRPVEWVFSILLTLFLVWLLVEFGWLLYYHWERRMAPNKYLRPSPAFDLDTDDEEPLQLPNKIRRESDDDDEENRFDSAQPRSPSFPSVLDRTDDTILLSRSSSETTTASQVPATFFDTDELLRDATQTAKRPREASSGWEQRLLQGLEDFMSRHQDRQPRIDNRLRHALSAVQNLTSVTMGMCSDHNEKIDKMMDRINEFMDRGNTRVSRDGTDLVHWYVMQKAPKTVKDLLSRGEDTSRDLLDGLLEALDERVPGFNDADRSKVRRGFHRFHQTYTKHILTTSQILADMRDMNKSAEFESCCARLETECAFMYTEGMGYWLDSILKDL